VKPRFDHVIKPAEVISPLPENGSQPSTTLPAPVSPPQEVDCAGPAPELTPPGGALRGARNHMRQATTAKVRLDAGKAACFRASARPTGRFDRQQRTLRAIYRCRRRRKGRSWLQTIGNPGNVDLIDKQPTEMAPQGGG
jgi:hypothetical protein